MNKEIFIHYFKGQISSEDEKTLLDWIDESESNKQEFIEARRAWDMLLLTAPIEAERRIIRWNFRHIALEIGKVAAVIAVVSSIAFALYKRHERNMAQISQTIEAPAGQMVKVSLPDGTKVWLNSKSKLTYDFSYGAVVRNVKLNGEAFFDVAHDKKHPFIVSAGRYDVTALGTAFNVYAYDESGNNLFSTSLIRGKVSVVNASTNERVILTPNMKAVIDHGRLKAESTSATEDMQWKDGVYSFNDMTLADILERLERYYDVTIDIQNKTILSSTCTGKFRKNEGITHILDVIKAEANFRYQYNAEKQQVTIY
jgi:Fe2+-dicitrate sensor, membrane component